MHTPPPPPMALLAPEQEGSADALVDLLITIARRIVAERPPAQSPEHENVLELPNREQKQAA